MPIGQIGVRTLLLLLEVDSDPAPQGCDNDDGLTNGLATSRHATALQPAQPAQPAQPP